jgi:diguanylate cyclase (GGDEF)-like protein
MIEENESRIPLNDLLVFHQVARSLTSSFDLETILRIIIEHMERFIDAEQWTLLMLDEPRQELYYAITAGARTDASLRELRIKVGEGVGGWVVQHGKTLLVPEAQPEADQDERVKVTRGVRPDTVRSVIALPLRGRKGTNGAIEIFNPRAEQLTDYTISLLHILADHAAIAIENAQDVARIQQLTITDDTTGLFNVRHLYDVLNRELERSARLGMPVSLAFLDLDRFKLVNDAHGHLVGSELLALVGQRLRELSRKRDLCFRYGGDEFVILMPDTGETGALRQASELNGALMETEFRMKNGLELRASASAGVATAPADGATVHAIIGAADARMYAAKSDERGAVRGR